MRVRMVGVGVAVAAAALALSGCGNSGPASTTGTTRPATTSSSNSSPASTSTTASSAVASTSSVLAALPVVTCQTDYAIATTTTTSLPSSVSVRVPSNEADNLAVYGDTQGIMMLLGPKNGWTCHGLYGADGSGGLLLSPIGESVPGDAWGWHLSAGAPTEAIVGIESGGSDVQGAGLVCALFASAAASYARDQVGTCSTRPTQEGVTTISAVADGFEDPSGVVGNGVPSGGQYAANGVALYQPKPSEPTAYVATCTLPAYQHDLCTAVLNHFIVLYG